MGEVTEQFDGLPVVGPSCLDFGIESSNVNSRSTNRNFGFKSGIRDWVHTFVANFSLLLSHHSATAHMDADFPRDYPIHCC